MKPSRSQLAAAHDCLSEWERDCGVYFTGRPRAILESRIARLLAREREAGHIEGVSDEYHALRKASREAAAAIVRGEVVGAVFAGPGTEVKS